MTLTTYDATTTAATTGTRLRHANARAAASADATAAATTTATAATASTAAGTSASTSSSTTVSLSDMALKTLSAVGDAATTVEHLAEAGWQELKTGIARLEHAGEVAFDDLEDGVKQVAAASVTTATALGHYASVALDAATSVVSDVTLSSANLLAML